MDRTSTVLQLRESGELTTHNASIAMHAGTPPGYKCAVAEPKACEVARMSVVHAFGRWHSHCNQNTFTFRTWVRALPAQHHDGAALDNKLDNAV